MSFSQKVNAHVLSQKSYKCAKQNGVCVLQIKSGGNFASTYFTQKTSHNKYYITGDMNLSSLPGQRKLISRVLGKLQILHDTTANSCNNEKYIVKTFESVLRV